MPKLNLKKLTLLLSILSLNACASIEVPNEPVCVELTPERGFCTEMLTGRSFEVDETHLLNGKTWWEMRVTMLQVPPTTYAETKKFIIKICKKTKQCSDQEIASWNRFTEAIDKKLEEKQ